MGNTKITQRDIKPYTALIVRDALLLFILLFSCNGCVSKQDKLFQRDIDHIKSLGIMLLQYAYDHDEVLPEKLSLVYDGYCDIPEYWVCENATKKTPIPKSANDIDKGFCDYLYFGKGYNVSNYPKELPILITKPGIFPDDSILILYKDGLVVRGKSGDIDTRIFEFIEKEINSKHTDNILGIPE